MSLKSPDFRHYVLLKKWNIFEKDNGESVRTFEDVEKVWAALFPLSLQNAQMSAVFAKTVDVSKKFYGFFEMGYRAVDMLDFDAVVWNDKLLFRSSVQQCKKGVWLCVVVEKQ